MKQLCSWVQLVLTLPTRNATARMRVWRTLKSMGCGVLRDGVYLLPGDDTHVDAFEQLAKAVDDAGGTATVIELTSRSREQDDCFRRLFDRTDGYAEFCRGLNAARKSIKGKSVSDLHRLQRRVSREFEALRATDFFPSAASARSEAAWQDFTGLLATVLAPDEPHAATRPLHRKLPEEYTGRIWATRRHVWVDRIASAWLIRRFIDPQAKFLWLTSPKACPKKAVGFDFDGATFTHVGERVTFEVLIASFGFDSDGALMKLGALVHALDVGGNELPEAAGFEAVMAGARERGLDDDAMLDEIAPILDSFYAYFRCSDSQGRRG
jgi:hypothetical protein